MNNMAKNWKSILFYILIPVLLIGAVWYLSSNQSGTEVQYSQVVQMFEENQVKDFSLDLSSGALTYKTFKDPEKEQRYTVPNVSLFLDDVKDNVDAYNAKQTNNKNRITYNYKKGASGNWFTSMLPSLIMLIAIVGLGFYAFRRMNNAMMNDTNKTLGFGKIRAKTLVEDEKRKTTFQDVAGCDEEKGELEEIVEFLKNPDSFTALGARIPRGVLLVGPPGTGKTLLARAVAGEAGAPFLSISGSDFVEMYVGVGASRVRDLFDKAKKSMPCIIFIDEIDAVGRQRGAGLGGGHDEREQTLNQLLVEMDGFEANDGIIVMAATNRADILDKALLRPGRFDRQVYVGLPDVKGREEILKVHTKKKPLAPDVSLRVIAQRTAGFAGADLENLVNEAALLAARRNRKAITMEDIEEASMKVMAGPEKKSRVVTPEEKKLTAYHEAGHAVAGFYCKHHPRVHEITIIPRGQAGGYTMYLPEKDRSYVTKGEMFEDIVSSLGGRVAEQLILEDISTGASNDLQQATNIARQMITKYGFSERLGPVVYGTSQEETFLGRDLGQGKGYSETTAAEIDGEMRDIIDEAYETCRRTLTEHIDQLHALAKALMEREKLNEQEFNTIMAGGTLPPREGDEPEQTVQAAPAETAEQAQPAEAAEPAEQAETAQPLPETAAPETPDAQDPQN